MKPTDLPPVTDAHRRAAFELLAMRGWTYEAAQADPVRSRVIEARAAHLRTSQWKSQHQQTTRMVRRYNPRTRRWFTQCVPGDFDCQQPLLEF